MWFLGGSVSVDSGVGDRRAECQGTAERNAVETAERNAEETTESNAKEAAEQNAEGNAERWGLERITTMSKMKCVLKEEREMITIDEINAQISLLPKTMISCIRQAGGNGFHA